MFVSHTHTKKHLPTYTLEYQEECIHVYTKIYHLVPLYCFAVIQTGRLRRQVEVNVTRFKFCKIYPGMSKLEKCMNTKSYNLSCQMMRRNQCYYWVTCKKRPAVSSWTCEVDHLMFGTPACCHFICP